MARYTIVGNVSTIIFKDSKSYLRIGLSEDKITKVSPNYYIMLFNHSIHNFQAIQVRKDEDQNIYYIDLEFGSGLESSAILGHGIEIKFDQIENGIIDNTSIKSISIGGYSSSGGGSYLRWELPEETDSSISQEEQHTEPISPSRKFLQEEADSSKLQKEGQSGEPKMRVIRRKL